MKTYTYTVHANLVYATQRWLVERRNLRLRTTESYQFSCEEIWRLIGPRPGGLEILLESRLGNDAIQEWKEKACLRIRDLIQAYSGWEDDHCDKVARSILRETVSW